MPYMGKSPIYRPSVLGTIRFTIFLGLTVSYDCASLGTMDWAIAHKGMK